MEALSSKLRGDYSIVDCHGLNLVWDQRLEGGGKTFGQDFVPIVQYLFGPVGRLYDFCAGPGYVGFSLLANDLCDNLVLSDVNPRAVDALRETVRINQLEEKVTVYESDGLESIPEEECWDLVVSNPPHFANQRLDEPSLIMDDLDWRLHRDFFAKVGDFLSPSGSVLICENSRGATPDVFLPMIADGGLSHIRTLWYPGGFSATAYFYFLWVKKTLPGLMLEDEPTVAVLPLREPAAEPLEIAADQPCSIQLVNETGRTVRPRLHHESGEPSRWLPFNKIDAGDTVPLPLVALRVGEYELRDKAEDVTVGTLIVREPGSGA